jgi:acetyl esterase/lipase
MSGGSGRVSDLFRWMAHHCGLRWMCVLASLCLSGVARAEVPEPNPLVGDGGVSDFYHLRGPVPPMPGEMIRTEALPDALMLPKAATGLRILYSSTDGLDGKTPIAVSGALFLPKGERPAEGWPLVAWAHGTVGIADVCAPSWAGRDSRDTTYLDYWLSQGYAIVATDYQGLGTPGAHPYLATRSEAMGVLDSIRAAQRGPYGIGHKVVVIGQSQGGGAAFATAGFARFYAPELDIRGTVATGTPYFDLTRENPTAADRDPTAVDPTLGFNLVVMHVIREIVPDFRFSELATPAGEAMLNRYLTQCYGEVAARGVADKVSIATAFKSDPFTSAPFMRVYPTLAFDTLKAKAPLFMGIGGVDVAVPSEGQLRLFANACKAGSVIEAHLYPDLDHFGTVNGSVPDSSVFVRKAFAGKAIPGNCGTVP